MASAVDQAAPDSVTAAVQFTVNTGQIPVAIVSDVGSIADERTGKFESRDIEIRNGRPLADRLDIDREGFALMRVDTAVDSFFDDDVVRGVYYPEMDRLVRQITGCDKVVVFDHTIRIDDAATREERGTRAPVRNVHNDFTIRSVAQRVRDLLPPEEAEARLKKRYGSINIWRPLAGPVETAPLAICEYDSIADGDLIAAERHYQGRIGGVYNFAYNPGQRWYYFPKMMRDEVIVLKCFDSLADGTARWTGHGSFEDPNTPPGAAPRQSIEIRTLYFFD